MIISIAVAAIGTLVLILWTNPGTVTVLAIVLITAILVLLANSFRPMSPTEGSPTG